MAILHATAATAGDLKANPQPAASGQAWDLAFGGSLMSDYNIRGITQSAHHPSTSAYLEPRYNLYSSLQFYFGVSGERVDFPNRAAAQVDLYGGVRSTIDRLAVDFGLWYYGYPGGTTFDGLGGASSCTTLNVPLCNTMKGNASFWEIYAKPVYALNDWLTIGGNVFFSPSVLNSGAAGTYGSVTTRATFSNSNLPIGATLFISGELGRYWLGTTDAFYGVRAFPQGIKLPDYTTWNLGAGISFNRYTLDLRYYGSDLTKASCNVLTGDHTASFGGTSAVSAINPSGLISNWCSAALIGKISFDATLSGLK
jgi:uncharacterized protein (TIGR02001 family)